MEAGLPQRVLMTADTIGGVWTYCVDLVAQLDAAGVSVELVAMGDEPSAGQRAAIDRLERVRLHARPYKLVWMDEPFGEVDQANAWIAELAAEHDVDLVHLNTLGQGDLGLDVPVVTVGHSCVFSWFEAVEGRPPGDGWQRYRRRVEQTLRSADLVVAPTRAMLDALGRHYGPLGPRRAILNGRDPSGYHAAEPEPFVLAAGRLWDEAKNVRTLAEAASAIDWPVRVAGDPSHPDGGRAGFDGVELLGRLEPAVLADHYARASIYAWPARYEPFGLTPLEAALSGCALVLGDIPTLREVWGEAAYYASASDPDAVAAQIDRLIDDDALRRQAARRARQRAEQLTAARMAAQYLDAYAQLLAPGRRDEDDCTDADVTENGVNRCA